MSQVLAWGFLLVIPGLLLGSTGAVKRPGLASIPGVAVLLSISIAWLAGAGQPATVELDNWLPFLPDGRFLLRVDALSAFMLAVLGLVAICVYVYSLGYMEGDPGIRRFFAFLDVFVGAMALLVVAGNLAVLLIGWTGVGMTSYFLISFWREKPRTLNAGLQAIAANAVGDAALILTAVVVPSGCGDLTTLQTPSCTAGIGGAALLAALLIVAASAKSAQGPLYFWLPSAMAGPTPISALIHAATMVAAGVYLLARTQLVLSLSPIALSAVAALGVATALFGAVMALRQSNLKKGLAYSTVSQLGYMFAAIGFSAPFAAIFHLGSQAMFKALLFLSAGAVIHALGGKEELSDMGDLARHMPGVRLAFLVGACSLFGFPLTAGYFSKDAIVDAGLERFPALAWLLVIGVLLSGWYIGRLFFATFHGKASQAAGERQLHPISRLLTWPLVPLAAGSVLFGYVNFPSGWLARLLVPTTSASTSQPFITGAGVVALALGLIGFAGAGWWEQRQARSVAALPRPSWTDWAGAASVKLSTSVAAIQNGRTGRYVLATVLGLAVILVAGLKG